MAPLCFAAKLDPFLSLDCTRVEGVEAQCKERKGSNFAIWQPWAKVGSGFVLTSSGANYDGVSDDPMVQQIRNIRGFIAEAKRLGGRYDEVAALEDNLKELQVLFRYTG